MQQPTLSAVSPSSDYYDNSSSSNSIKQDPSTPYSPPNFMPEDIMNHLMFVDDQMKTEYNTGKLYYIYIYIYILFFLN
jgi:hypothetical protein